MTRAQEQLIHGHERGPRRWRMAVRLGFGMAVGAAAAVTLGNHFLGMSAHPWGRQAVAGLVLSLSFGFAASGMLVYVILPRCSAHLSRRASIVCAIASLLAGSVLMVVVPVRVPLWPMRHRLEIVATGDRNPLAEGSEVWVIGLWRPDGSKLPMSELALGKGWEVRDGVLLSYQNQPAVLAWEGWLDGDLTAEFVSHPWSGVVSVRWSGSEQELDLYDSAGQNSPRKVTLAADSHGPPGLTWVLLVAGLSAADIVSLGTLVFAVSMLVMTRRPASCAEAVPVSRWAWACYAMPCACVWTVWLLAFWPGLMSPDSVDQWGQVLAGRFNDWHPAFHTITNWLVTRLWLSPGAVALAQVGTQSAIVGCGLARVRRLGAPAIALWPICLIFALSPLFGTMVITLWKDIAYGISLLALTVLIMEVATSHGAWLEQPARWALLAVVAALVALYRHNGPVAGFGTLVVLALAYRRQRRPLLGALGLAVALWLGVRGPLYGVVGVTGQRWAGLQPLIHQVAAHIAAGTRLEEGERALLNHIRPLADGWRYSCWTIVPTVFDGRFDPAPIEGDPAGFVELWRALALRNPGVILQHLACSSSLVWRVTQPAGGGLYASALWLSPQDGPDTIASNQLGLRPEFLLPGLALPLAQWVVRSQMPEVSWALWRPALYLYLALSGAAVMSLRSRCWKCLLVVSPVALHSLALMGIVVAQDARFQYPVHLVGLLMVAAAFCRPIAADRL